MGSQSMGERAVRCVIQRVTADCTAGYPDLLLELTRHGALTRMATCAELNCGQLPDKVAWICTSWPHMNPRKANC